MSLGFRVWVFFGGLGFRFSLGFRGSGLGFTWRVGGLSNWLFNRLISTITPLRISFKALITLLNTYLLSSRTLQVGVEGLGVQIKLPTRQGIPNPIP